MFEIPFDYLMFVNIVLILFLLLSVYRGYKEGMLLQLVNLVNTFVAAAVAWLFSDVFVSVYAFVTYSKAGMPKIDAFFTQHANRLIWFFVLFVVIRILLMALKPIASLISKMPLIKQVNSILGAFFGIVVYVIYLNLLIYFLTLPVIKNGNDVIENSYLKKVHEVSQPVLKNFDEVMRENTSVQYLINEKELSVSQKQSIVDFLSKNGFSNEEIREFLIKYHE